MPNFFSWLDGPQTQKENIGLLCWQIKPLKKRNCKNKLSKKIASEFVTCHLMSLLLLQVMMMVLPLLIIVLLPKVVNTNDPEMRKVCSLCCVSELNRRNNRRCDVLNPNPILVSFWIAYCGRVLTVTDVTDCDTFLTSERTLSLYTAFLSPKTAVHSLPPFLYRKWSSPWTCWTPTLSFLMSLSSWPSSSLAPKAPARQAAAAKAPGQLPRGGSTVHAS